MSSWTFHRFICLFSIILCVNADYICMDSSAADRQCHQRFILDLGREFTDTKAFSIVQNFVFGAAKQCFNVNVAKEVFVTQASNSTLNSACCSMDTCSTVFNSLEYNQWVPNYGIGDMVNLNERANLDFAISLITILKFFDESRCSSNNIVLLSNRVFGALQPYFENIVEVLDYSNTTLSIVVVGRGHEMDLGRLKPFYAGITPNLYVVPDVSCTKWLSSCIFPCGNGYQAICTNDHQLSACQDGGIGIVGK